MMGPDYLGRLLDEQAAALVLYARQWCATPEDVVQEAFLKLVAQREPPAAPVAWLYRVVRNAAVSASRSERRRRQHEAAAASRAAPWLEAPRVDALDAEAASAALQALPLEEREVIVAHIWGRLTFEEIGALAGCSSSTAHRWYVSGLSALRERLGETCPSQEATPIWPSWKRS
jgi:RNA polymerase sigma-70 factor (ECF subfamily)